MDNNNQIFPHGNDLPNVDYQEMYRAVIEQIIKDFHPFSSQIEIPNILSSDFLREQISELIHQVLRNHPTQLHSILYRIDLSEKNLKSVPIELTESERHLVLVEQILRREAQKVWIRKKFG